MGGSRLSTTCVFISRAQPGTENVLCGSIVVMRTLASLLSFLVLGWRRTLRRTGSRAFCKHLPYLLLLLMCRAQLFARTDEQLCWPRLPVVLDRLPPGSKLFALGCRRNTVGGASRALVEGSVHLLPLQRWRQATKKQYGAHVRYLCDVLCCLLAATLPAPPRRSRATAHTRPAP
jgi:hypothetical protein